jgi:lipopolysaccharide export system permease protein
MTILSRYIVGELIKVFLVTLTALTTVMLLIGVVQEALRESLTPLTILRMVPYVLPNALCFAIPGTMLFAVSIVYGRMAAHNEIVAIKSAGVAPIVVITPVLVVACLLSLLTVFLNDVAVSWGRTGVYRVVLHSVEKTIYAVLSAERTYQRGRLSIVVEGVVDDELIRPVVQYFEDDDSQAQLTAQRARLRVNSEHNTLVFSVVAARMAVIGKDIDVTLPDGEIEIPLRAATKQRMESESASLVPLNAISTELQKARQRLESLRGRLALRGIAQFVGGDFVALTHPEWTARQDAMTKVAYRIHRLRTEPWRRWANGFSCLCFVLVGAPLAIVLRKADVWTSFALCFIPILLLYYPLVMFGLSSAKSGQIPPPAVWLGNLVLVVIGLWLVRRVVRR